MQESVAMQTYEVKRGHQKKVNLEALFQECFGDFKKEGDWLVGHFGAFTFVKAKWEGAAVTVDSENDKGAPPDVAMTTIRAWNKFLEGATALNAKQRGQRMQKAAKKAEA
jgi:hypothetical protein